jgi:hypothetical protein
VKPDVLAGTTFVFFVALGGVACFYVAEWLLAPNRRRTPRRCPKHVATLARGQVALLDANRCDLCPKRKKR